MRAFYLLGKVWYTDNLIESPTPSKLNCRYFFFVCFYHSLMLLGYGLSSFESIYPDLNLRVKPIDLRNQTKFKLGSRSTRKIYFGEKENWKHGLI